MRRTSRKLVWKRKQSNRKKWPLRLKSPAEQLFLCAKNFFFVTIIQRAQSPWGQNKERPRKKKTAQASRKKERRKEVERGGKRRKEQSRRQNFRALTSTCCVVIVVVAVFVSGLIAVAIPFYVCLGLFFFLRRRFSVLFLQTCFLFRSPISVHP